MGKLHYDETRITDAMNLILERTKRMDMSWDWPCGVAYYGLAEAYEVTKNESYLNFLKERVDELMELGLPVLTVNTCAMGHCLITLYQATGEEKYMDVIRLKTRYLTEEALRFGDYVLQHTVSADNDFPEQCWADTLFMAAFFLLRVGVMTGDETMIKDALNQYYWHIQYLQDEESGLWYHGYNNITKDHMSGFYWGRANCWAAYTMSKVGLILPQCYLYPQYLEIVGSLNEQLSALKGLQTENGLWRTILDDEESYEEVSASAGIAAAMALKRNPLHIKYVERSIEGILSHVAADGRVTDVSGGTAVMKDREGYRNISKKWIQGWGQGMALAFFCAVLNYDKIAGDGAL
ncbi:unsaturated rhamnogalacturonyl hydrolase [Lacrimispora xylanisolvens]|uniref:Unsaturated rhamnogalacturonyl hydrolase n=1 Tax=Lacrimispora xylanisolvens TaxID=384636 RepID=A0A2S6HP45_9FIRM|nr:glycoside hydrolase family 88 protein [Hungatella xylanolytica]PPK79317.1 unsaturated rhamnogalacturonyl hydrolase [Hungatella xylanolytica]